MSRQLALDCVHLRTTPRFGHTEYSLEYHEAYMRQRLGETADDVSRRELLRRFYDSWGIDFLWCTNDGLHGDWAKRGRATDMGHAAYAADASDLRQDVPSPFTDVEEVWAFDAAAEYGLPAFDEQVRAYEAWLSEARAAFPEQLSTGGYYKSIVSGAIQAFGWDMLLMAAADRAKMERVFEGFFRRTLFHMRAWAATSVEVVIQHDDFVWSSGPFMDPEIYRKVLIPMYAELWKPLRAAGKKVLFCSDGLFTQFMPDVAEAGADGFIFEPVNDWAHVASEFGRSHCLVGSDVDCRDMTFGTWETVRAKIERTLEHARKCRGVILAVGNHLPPNIAPAMMEQYVNHLQANWGRA